MAPEESIVRDEGPQAREWSGLCLPRLGALLLGPRCPSEPHGTWSIIVTKKIPEKKRKTHPFFILTLNRLPIGSSLVLLMAENMLTMALSNKYSSHSRRDTVSVSMWNFDSALTSGESSSPPRKETFLSTDICWHLCQGEVRKYWGGPQKLQHEPWTYPFSLSEFILFFVKWEGLSVQWVHLTTHQSRANGLHIHNWFFKTTSYSATKSDNEPLLLCPHLKKKSE